MTNKAAIPLMIGGPLLGVLVGYWLGKPSNSPSVAKAKSAAPEPSAAVNGKHGQPGVDMDEVKGYPVTQKTDPLSRAIQNCKVKFKGNIKNQNTCILELTSKFTTDTDKKRIYEVVPPKEKTEWGARTNPPIKK
jgi:hypothetical protein